MAARGLNVFVQIGAKLLPSLNTTAGAAERRLAQMGRGMRLEAAKTKVAYRELAGAMKPIVAMAAAGGLTMGLKGIFGSGNEYGHELAMLRIAGRTTSEVSQAIAQANKTMRDIPTSTLADNLKVIRETTGAYGDFGHALHNLDFNQKLGYMMSNTLGIDPTEASRNLVSGIQALEVRGTAMDPHKYQREMGELFRAMAFFAGKEGAFDASQLKAFTQTGNIPIKGYGERFMTRILPSLITELGGGDVTGTQASAFRNQIMGRVPLGGKKLTEEWVRLGLVPASAIGAGTLTRNGWQPGAVKGHALAMADPFAWMEQVMLPAMTAKGINVNDPNAVILQMSKMFGRETAVRFATMLADPRQRKRLHKDEANIAKAMPLDKSFELMMATDPNAAIAKTMASIKNLETIMGKAVTPEVIAGLNNLAKGINWLASVFEAHPSLAKIAILFMGFGAAGAMLKVFEVSLRFVLSPLKAVWALLFKVGPRQIGLVGWLLRGLTKGFARLGPIVLRGAMAIGPWLLRGIAAAFGLLSNPVGWAVLAASALALLWAFRKEIAASWRLITFWFANVGLPAVKAGLSAVVNWGSQFVDNLIAGIAANWGRLTSWFSSKMTSLWSTAQSGYASGRVGIAGVGGSGMGIPAPTVAGHRALGGGVERGKLYEVGERGRELFAPGMSGTIIPNSELVRRREARSAGVTVGNINIYGANDPASTRRVVREELQRMANGQSVLLND